MKSGIAPFKPASWLGGTVALLLSAALHLGLFHWNPDLRVAGGGRPGTPPVRRAPATQLDEVQIEIHRREIRRLVESYAARPELEPPVLDPLIEEALPEVDTTMAFEPALSATVAPAELERRLPDLEEPGSDWQPMQEILRISQDRVREEVSSIPRPLLREHPRSPVAPDLSFPPVSDELPADPDPVSVAGDGRGVDLGAPVLAAPHGRAAGQFPGPLPLPEAWGDDVVDEPPFLPEETVILERLTETREAITELEAVEALLGLRTQTFIDPNDPDSRYFKIQLVREGVEALPVMPRQVVFMIDCSESMTQARLREAADGISRALDTLSPGDTFNVIAFRDEPAVLFDRSRTANAVNLANARGFLAQLRAFGSADVVASLHALKQLEQEPGRPLIALLVTDGVPTMSLTESSELIERFTRANDGRISVFTVGGGRRVNRYLLDFLSYRNRGESMVAEQNRQLPEAILTTARQIRRPVMSHLDYRFTGDEAFEMYPKQLSHLFLDRPLILVGRVPVTRERIAFQILGESSGVSRDMIFRLDLTETPRGPWSLRTEWAWQALLHATGEYLQGRDPAWRRRIETLSRRYGLQVPYADELEQR